MNLTQFVRLFTTEELFSIRDVVVIGRNCYLASSSLRRIASSFNGKPFAIGMYLGKEEGALFVPSFQLLDWIMLHSSKKVTVNDKAAWLVICGRDVFRHGILEAPEGLCDSDFVLIQNSTGECLGYGRFCPEKKIAITLLLDRGDFLRRETLHPRRKRKSS